MCIDLKGVKKWNILIFTKKTISPQKLLLETRLLPNTQEKVIFLGDGSELYRPLIEESLGSKAAFAPPYLSHPRAAIVALLGLEEIKRGKEVESASLTPIYVRPSEAELHWGLSKGGSTQ